MAADGPGSTPDSESHAVVRDWLTIWHSELAALALDPDMRASWLRLLDAWAQTAERALRFLPAGEPKAGHAGPVAPARPAAPVAAPDPRDAAIHALEQRLAALERRLAAGSGDAPGDGPGPGA